MSFYFGGLLPPGSAYNDFLELMKKHDMKFCLVREMDEFVPFMKNLEESKKSDSAQEVKNEDNVQRANPAENSEKSDGVDHAVSKSVIESQPRAVELLRNQSFPLITKKFATRPIRTIIRPRYQKSQNAVDLTLPGSSLLGGIIKEEENEEMSKLEPVSKIAARWASPFAPPDQGLELKTEDDDDDKSDVVSMDHYDSQADIDELIEDEMVVEEFEEEAILKPSNVPSEPPAKKKFECGVCNRGFSKPQNLKVHYRTHTGERRFKCEVCNERFGTKGNLQRHMRVHSDDKGIECEFCHKFYSCSQGLVRHMLIHRGEKPFSCDICGDSFACQSNLGTHKLSHGGEKNYLCTVCGKGFVAKAYLSKHKRIHSGKKPFECEVCKKATDRSTLRNHLLTHAEKKLECTECHKKFTRPAYLKKHCSTFHGLEILE